MPTPIAPRIILSQNTRENLHTLIRAHSTPQALALRARLVLRAADFDRPTTLHISRELSCDNRTAGKWRRRYLDLGLSGLQEAIRAGRPKVSAPPHSRSGHLGGQRPATRPRSHRHQVDMGCNRCHLA